MLLKRLEKCHSELSSLTSHLQENEVYNHLNDKVATYTLTLSYCFIIYLEEKNITYAFSEVKRIAAISLLLILCLSVHICMNNHSSLFKDKLINCVESPNVQDIFGPVELNCTGV